MKSLKAAAVVAGSLVVAGSAAPAFAAAHDTAALTPTSLNGAVNALTAEPIDMKPLKNQSRALDTENKDSVLHTVKGATSDLNSKKGLLGVKGATRDLNSKKGLLGGLPLGG